MILHEIMRSKTTLFGRSRIILDVSAQECDVALEWEWV
jgi:hypothetical protein